MLTYLHRLQCIDLEVVRLVVVGNATAMTHRITVPPVSRFSRFRLGSSVGCRVSTVPRASTPRAQVSAVFVHAARAFYRQITCE